MSLAGVVMIHDEAGTIGRAVESFAKVCEPIIGLDVGSKDGATEIARGLGVELHRQDWQTHGKAAETLLRLARRRADYALLFGATETVEQVGPIPKLTAPMYELKTLVDNCAIRTERIFASGIEWTCPGPVHSTIKPPFFDEREELAALVITTHDDDGRRPEKLARARDELEAWLLEHPHDHRSVYYLANTYYHLGALNAAAGLFKRRAAMSNGDIESWHALYMAGACEMAYSFEAGAHLMIEAFKQRPGRMEPLQTLEQALHQIRAQTAVPTEGELIWVDENAYLKGK